MSIFLRPLDRICKKAVCREYLGRYTHRIAISNNRIKSIDNGNIVFTYRDRANNNELKETVAEMLFRLTGEGITCCPLLPFGLARTSPLTLLLSRRRDRFPGRP
ncbi:MAG: transposase, partial [Desulfobacterales bacterium]